MSNSAMTYSDDDEEVTTIRVIAPATLAEGYTFDVLVDDAPYTVQVPKGGVKEGQEFEVLYDPRVQVVPVPAPRHGHGSQSRNRRVSTPTYASSKGGTSSGGAGHAYDEEESTLKRYEDEDEEDTRLQECDTIPVQTMSDDDGDEDEKETKFDAKTVYDETTGAPMGRWRAGLCTCCDVITQSTFWMGVCCTPVLIAQLITRLKLTWNGGQGTPQAISLSFNKILLSMMIILALWKIPIVGDFVLLLFYLLIVVYVGSIVRAHMRVKYEIPTSLPQKCGPRMDDGCCMLFCGCCSAIQMARHTHNDKEFPGHGCTTTGLGLDAPHII